MSHRLLNVPEWATEITISAGVEYGNIYFAVSSGDKISYPFDESLVNCVGSALSSSNTSSSCVIENPKSGVWKVAFYGLDPENKFTLAVAGEMDWTWRYEVVSDAGDVVRDKVTGLEWRRCSVGEMWNQINKTCDGVPSALWGYEAASYSDNGGFRAPTITELRSIVYCHTGKSNYFVEGEKEVCKVNGQAPIVTDIFPFDRNDSEIVYWSSSSNGDSELKTVVFNSGWVRGDIWRYGGHQNRLRLVR